MAVMTLLTFLLATASLAWANQFVDDYGRVHILRDKPRIFCSAYTAVGLLHLGTFFPFNVTIPFAEPKSIMIRY